MGSTPYPSNWPKSECWLMMSFGESVKKEEPCDHADGKECGWCCGPGEISGNAGEIDTQ